MDALVARYDALKAGQPGARVVVLQDASGVGKSRIIRIVHPQLPLVIEDLRLNAWGKAAGETKKRIVRLLGMRIAINRVEPGNDGAYDPESVEHHQAQTRSRRR